LQKRECWILRERHGSQAIRGASSRAFDVAQHVYPQHHFALTSSVLQS
jgi:hypothetical protein